MQPQPREPSLSEMQEILESAERCLLCSATATSSGSPCYEFTPGGVEVCSAMPWWNGRPLTRETLQRWKQVVVSYQAVPRRPDD